MLGRAWIWSFGFIYPKFRSESRFRLQPLKSGIFGLGGRGRFRHILDISTVKIKDDRKKFEWSDPTVPSTKIKKNKNTTRKQTGGKKLFLPVN